MQRGDSNSRRKEALKAFQVEGYEDEFRIAGSDHSLDMDDLFEIVPLRQSPPTNKRVIVETSSVVPFWATVGTVVLFLASKRFLFPKRSTCHRGASAGDATDCSKPSTSDVDTGKVRNEISQPNNRHLGDFSIIQQPSSEFASASCSSREAVGFVECIDFLTSDSPPDLEDEILPSSTLVSFESSSVVTMSYPSKEDLKEEFRSDVIVRAQAFMEVCQESGIKANDEVCLKAALINGHTHAIRQSSFQAEMRGYHFEAYQRSQDRQTSQQQHREVITCLKEEKDWLQKLLAARNECFYAMTVALFRSCIIFFGCRPLLAFLRLAATWRSSSYRALAYGMFESLISCSERGELRTPVATAPLDLASLTTDFLSSLIPDAARILADSTSCLVYNLSALVLYMICLVLIFLVTKTFGLPFYSTAALIGLLVSDNVTTIPPWSMVLTSFASAVIATCYILLHCTRSRTLLQNKPSSECLSQCLEPLLSLRDYIYTVPLIILAGIAVDFTYSNQTY